MKDHFSLKMFALAFDDLCNASYNPRKEVIKEGGCECGVCALVLACLFVCAGEGLSVEAAPAKRLRF